MNNIVLYSDQGADQGGGSGSGRGSRTQLSLTKTQLANDGGRGSELVPRGQRSVVSSSLALLPSTRAGYTADRPSVSSELDTLDSEKLARWVKMQDPRLAPAATDLVRSGITGAIITQELGCGPQHFQRFLQHDLGIKRQFCGALHQLLTGNDTVSKVTARICDGDYGQFLERSRLLPPGRELDKLADARRFVNFCAATVSAGDSDVANAAHAKAIGLAEQGKALFQLQRFAEAASAFRAASDIALTQKGKDVFDRQAQDASKRARQKLLDLYKEFCATDLSDFAELMRRAALDEGHVNSLSTDESVYLLMQIVTGGAECADRLQCRARLNARQRRPGKFFFLLGDTGLGKSTCLNYANGCNYKKNGESELRPLGTEITAVGNHGESKTFFAKPFEIGDHLFIDCPGYGDTKGPVIAIGNSVNVRNVLNACIAADWSILCFLRTAHVEADSRAKTFERIYEDTKRLFCNNQAFVQQSGRIVCVFNGEPANRKGEFLENFTTMATNFMTNRGTDSDTTQAWLRIVLKQHVFVDCTRAGGGRNFISQLEKAASRGVDSRGGVANPITAASPFQVQLQDAARLRLSRICRDASDNIEKLIHSHTSESLSLVHRNWAVVKSLVDIVDDDIELQQSFKLKLPQALVNFARHAFPLQQLLREPTYSYEKMLSVQNTLRSFDAFARTYPNVHQLTEMYEDEAKQAAESIWDVFQRALTFEAPMPVDATDAIDHILSVSQPSEVLCVAVSASRKEILFAFHALCKLVHPDKNSGVTAKQAFQKLAQARQQLLHTGGNAVDVETHGCSMESVCKLLQQLSVTANIVHRVRAVIDAPADAAPPAVKRACALALKHISNGTWLLQYAQLVKVPTLLEQRFKTVTSALDGLFAQIARTQLEAARDAVLSAADSVFQSLSDKWPAQLQQHVSELQQKLSKPTLGPLKQTLEKIARITGRHEVQHIATKVKEFYQVGLMVRKVVDLCETESKRSDLLGQCSRKTGLDLADINNQLRTVCLRASTAANEETTIARLDALFDKVALQAAKWSAFPAAQRDLAGLRQSADTICGHAEQYSAGAGSMDKIRKHVVLLMKRVDSWRPLFVGRLEKQLDHHLKNGDVDSARVAAEQLAMAGDAWPELVEELRERFTTEFATCRKEVNDCVIAISKIDNIHEETAAYDDRFRHLPQFFVTAHVHFELSGDSRPSEKFQEQVAWVQSLLEVACRELESYPAADDRVVPQLVAIYACAEIADQPDLHSAVTKAIKAWLNAFQDPLSISQIGKTLLSCERTVQYVSQLLNAFPKFKRIQVKLHKQYASVGAQDYYAALLGANPAAEPHIRHMKAIFDDFEKRHDGACGCDDRVWCLFAYAFCVRGLMKGASERRC